jgi:hypothetical protein
LRRRRWWDDTTNVAVVDVVDVVDVVVTSVIGRKERTTNMGMIATTAIVRRRTIERRRGLFTPIVPPIDLILAIIYPAGLVDGVGGDPVDVVLAFSKK